MLNAEQLSPQLEESSQESFCGLPMPEVQKLNKVDFLELMCQRDQSAKFIFDLFSICGYKSVSEVKSMVKAKNNDLYLELDDIIYKLNAINAIKTVGDDVVWHCREGKGHEEMPSDPSSFRKYAGSLINSLVNRTLDDCKNNNTNASKQNLSGYTLPADETTVKELKAAAHEYRKKVERISEESTTRKSTDLIIAYVGQSIPTAEDF